MLLLKIRQLEIAPSSAASRVVVGSGQCRNIAVRHSGLISSLQ